jgi:threonine dehydrogenase-like Zn-dependent dehydrogenase
MDSFSVDVAIIGGGPVGLFASHLLSSRGVTVAVLEKELDEFPYPRAVQFNSDILRSFRSASTKLSRLMLEHVQLVPEMVCTRSPMKSNTVMCNTGGAKVRPVRKMTCALALVVFDHRSSITVIGWILAIRARCLGGGARSAGGCSSPQEPLAAQGVAAVCVVLLRHKEVKGGGEF